MQEIYCSIDLNCPCEEAYSYFVEKEKLEKWLTLRANVSPVQGGAYELFWNLKNPKVDSTIGCQIRVFAPPNLLHVTWKGPQQFSHFMNETDPLTCVTIVCTPLEGSTNVSLLHTGWRGSEDWLEARAYFVSAWNTSLALLQKAIHQPD